MIALTRIQDQVREAASKSKALRIVGGDSKRGLGREPVGNPIKVSDLTGVVEYQPTELMITVQAGTTISHLRDVLAEKGQMLAVRQQSVARSPAINPGHRGRGTDRFAIMSWVSAWSTGSPNTCDSVVRS
jgi:FAD/FMN-containing dehydrogenase